MSCWRIVIAVHRQMSPVEKVHARHEPVDVIQARRGVGLPEVELQRSAEERDRGEGEQTHLDDDLADRERQWRDHVRWADILALMETIGQQLR